MYILKYSERESSYNSKSKHNKFVGVDDSSGGYPYAVDHVAHAQVWTNLDKVKGYMKSFPCLDLYEVEFKLTPKKIDE